MPFPQIAGLESNWRLLAFPVGLAVVVLALLSAVRTFVLPRSAPDALTQGVFGAVRALLSPWMRRARSYQQRDRAMAFYAPVGLLTLLPTWLALVLAGYMAMFWALGVPTWREAFVLSGSSLLTLGFAGVGSLAQAVLAFTEATLGLILVALLIAYLPTMYTAFARREAAVALLEVRAGSPPWAVELFERYTRLGRLDQLHDLWLGWEMWFADVEESHTSLAPLAFFRSPQADRSWVTASGAVLDAAALAASTIDIPHDLQADLCIRAGYLALRRVADFFNIPYNPLPQSGDPIALTREEFDAAYERLEEAGVPLKPDREQCWRDFAGWRVNYDTVLIELAGLTMAPYAPWSSDRSLTRQAGGIPARRARAGWWRARSLARRPPP
jgi:hypothetical protein